jgi:hypothetical protein
MLQPHTQAEIPMDVNLVSYSFKKKHYGASPTAFLSKEHRKAIDT